MRPSHGRCTEEARDEQQSAAEKKRREKSTFKLAQTVPQDAYEPKECNPGKWNQVQREAHGAQAMRLGKPYAGLARVRRDCVANQAQSDNRENRKNDARESRAARRSDGGRLRRGLPAAPHAAHIALAEMMPQ